MTITSKGIHFHVNDKPVDRDTMFDDLILSQLDPLFRRCMLVLVTSKGSCLYDVESTTIEDILKTHYKEDIPYEKLLTYIRERYTIHLQVETFPQVTLRHLINHITAFMPDASLMYPSILKRMYFGRKDVRLGSKVIQGVGDDATVTQYFSISTNHYIELLNIIEQSAKLDYKTIVSPHFIFYWNSIVREELALPEDQVLRFIRVPMFGKPQPDFTQPKPFVDRDYPLIRGQARSKRGQFRSILFGDYSISKHIPLIQENIDRNQDDRDSKDF